MSECVTYRSVLMVEGFVLCIIVGCSLTVMIVTLIQSHLDFHLVAVLFLQTQSHGRGLILNVLSPKYPKIQSSGGHNINMYCMVVG
jgi:hypothetical protein